MAFGLIVAAATAVAAPGHRAYITRAKGTVQMQREGRGPWHAVRTRAHRALYTRDHVQTLVASEATIAIDGCKVALQPRTHVIIPPAREASSRKPSRIRLVAGRVWAWLIGGRDIEISAAGAVAAAEGTRFVLEAEPGQPTTLTVLEGTVRFYNEFGSVVVGEGEQSSATEGSAPTRPMRVDPSGYIEWEADLSSVDIGLEFRDVYGDSPSNLRQRVADDRYQVELHPERWEDHLDLARALADLGDLQDAEDSARRALALTEESGDALAPQDCLVELGRILLLQRRAPEALEAFSQLTMPGSGSLRAVALLNAGGSANVEAAAQAVTEARAAIAASEASAKHKAESLALADLVTGAISIRAGDAAGAREVLERAAQSGVMGSVEAYPLLCQVQLAQGDGAAALETARTAVEQAPVLSASYVALASAEFFVGDLGRAREAIDKALELRPDSASASLVASDIHVASGDLDAGLRYALAAVTLDPELGPAHSALGMIYLALNDLNDAEQAFSKALDATPDLVSARTGMGVTYARQGSLGKAMEMQKAAVALDSRRVSALNNRGAVYLARGNLDAAVADFEQAIALQPEWSMPRANLAIAYLDLNQFANAVREGELAVSLGEDSARAHTTLGRIYLEQNRTDKAWAELRRALELDDSYSLAHLHIAEVYLRQGRSRDALNHQLEALTRQPSAILETREYSRTEARVEAGSLRGRLRTDGRGDDGQNSYYLSVSHEEDDADRAHSDYESTTWLGLAGRQTAAGRTSAIYATSQSDEFERPGRVLADGSPEDPDFRSRFRAQSAQYLTRRPLTDSVDLTTRIGYSATEIVDNNPDSLISDPKPFPNLKVRRHGPSVEARVDARLCAKSSLVVGAAAANEDTDVAGFVNRQDPPGSTTIVSDPFSNAEDTSAATYYAEYTNQLGHATELMVGGRLVTRKGAAPVLRPKAYLRHELGSTGTLVLLTRPVLRDDVSEISPVDDWALFSWVSPTDLGTGGYSQSYELQYQIMPTNASLFRATAFRRTLRNYIADLENPAWAPGYIGPIIGEGELSGAELHYERRLGRDLSGNVALRYTESENDDAGGLDIPYQPELTGALGLDYIDQSGVRAGVTWLYVGKRYADLSNAARLGSYNTLNLRLARQLSLQTDVFLSIDNILDEEDAFWQGYPNDGRKVRAGVEYRF